MSREEDGTGGKVILQLFCCVSTVALFFRRALSSSSSWPSATGGSSVTCNHCYSEAKDESLLSSPRLLMRKPEFLTSTSIDIFIPFVAKVERTPPVERKP